MNKSRWFYLVVALLIVASFLVTGCGPKEPGVIKVGLAATMSGPAAKTGEDVANGVRMAVKHWNDLGGVTVDGRKYQIKLIEYDNAGKPEQGVSATKKLIEQDEVLVGFGDWISTVALAQKPVIEAAGVPWIVFGAHPGLTEDRKYTFRSNNIARGIYEHLSRICIKEYGITEFSLLDAEDAFSQDMKEAIKAEIKRHGGTILTDDSFPPGHMDFYSMLTRIKAAAPKVVFSMSSTDAPTILKQAKEVGLETQWLFSNQMDAAVMVEQAGELAVGIWQAVTFNPEWDRPSVKEFVAEAKAFIGKLPILTNALGYEGTMRMFMAIEKADSLDREEIVKALYEVDWDGPFFIGKFDETGNGISAATLMRVTADGGYEPITKLHY